MRRAGILTGDVVIFILIAGGCISEHSSSSFMTLEFVDHNQLYDRPEGMSEL